MSAEERKEASGNCVCVVQLNLNESKKNFCMWTLPLAKQSATKQNGTKTTFYVSSSEVKRNEPKQSELSM